MENESQMCGKWVMLIVAARDNAGKSSHLHCLVQFLVVVVGGLRSPMERSDRHARNRHNPDSPRPPPPLEAPLGAGCGHRRIAVRTEFDNNRPGTGESEAITGDTQTAMRIPVNATAVSLPISETARNDVCRSFLIGRSCVRT